MYFTRPLLKSYGEFLSREDLSTNNKSLLSLKPFDSYIYFYLYLCSMNEDEGMFL